jgi:hypothetical protein
MSVSPSERRRLSSSPADDLLTRSQWMEDHSIRWSTNSSFCVLALMQWSSRSASS